MPNRLRLDRRRIERFDGIDRFVARKTDRRSGWKRKVWSRRSNRTPRRAARRPLECGDRAVSHRPVVRRTRKKLAEPAIAAVREGKTKFVPQNWENTYFNWMENIQPWCISRQLWWGHQIPAWYGPSDRSRIRYRRQCVQMRFVAATESDAISARKFIRKTSSFDVVEIRTDSRCIGSRGSRTNERYRFGATRTCSTPGSPRRCGRSRRSAGRTRRRSSRASIRPRRWSPASTSSSSGSRA